MGTGEGDAARASRRVRPLRRRGARASNAHSCARAAATTRGRRTSDRTTHRSRGGGGAPRRRRVNNRQIAKELSISERTVENHIGKILKKQGFSSRARIATWVAHR